MLPVLTRHAGIWEARWQNWCEANHPPTCQRHVSVPGVGNRCWCCTATYSGLKRQSAPPTLTFGETDRDPARPSALAYSRHSDYSLWQGM